MSGSSSTLNIDKSRPFSVGDWVVDAHTNQIQLGDNIVSLEPKVMDVLVYLAQRPGEVIERQELEDQVWAGMIVGYDSLSRSMAKLRKAFDDHPKEPRIVQTVSKRGYRLIATVSQADDTGSNSESTTSTASHVVPPTTRASSKLPFILIGSLLLVLVLALKFILSGSEPDQEVALQKEGLNEKASIIVLPFRNISNDPKQEYFSDGLTEDLITDLSAISSLFVISHATSMAYKGRDVDSATVGKELSVNYIVEGSVRKSGDQIRVSTQLSNAKTGFQLWGNRFDRPLQDVFKLQDEINNKIISALQLKLTEVENRRVMQRYTNSVEAYDVFLRGLSLVAAYSRESNLLARDKFNEAIDLDPQFARAYGALANTYRLEFLLGWVDASEKPLQRAEELARKAMAMNDQLPQIPFMLGAISRDKKDHVNAVAYAEKAVALDPNYAHAYVLLGSSLCFAGSPIKGLEMINKGTQLNPFYPSNYPFHQGICHFTAGKYANAIDALKRAIKKNPASMRFHAWLAASYALNGQLDDATWEVDELMSQHPDVTISSIKEFAPYKDPAHMKTLLDGLAKAGLAQ
jgi:TolB-like protein/DNA-binding winged helix-turn-helix (wHTH) protein/Tfp pilus assembly protein PilF